jgi:ADP-ribose pyrophosphatase
MNRQKPLLRQWHVLRSRNLLSAHPWVSVSSQTIRLPDGRVINDYYQIRTPEFAVFHVTTPDRKVIVIRQYKHGIGRVSLTLPGGLIDPSEKPLDTARRELLEETGYQAIGWRSLGNYVPNSNYGCGRAWFFTAVGAQKVAEPQSGDLEEMEIVLMLQKRLLAALKRGEVVSLSSAAIIALAANRSFRQDLQD